MAACVTNSMKPNDYKNAASYCTNDTLELTCRKVRLSDLPERLTWNHIVLMLFFVTVAGLKKLVVVEIIV